MNCMVKIALILSGVLTVQAAQKTVNTSKEKNYAVDLIIFSYERPMQLYALLESLDRRFQGIGQTTVIYRSDTQRYHFAYAIVQATFPHVRFIQQKKPPYDFKKIVIEELHNTRSDYVAFAVDDLIAIRPCNLKNCAELLELHDAYAFYLRLGTHICSCYTEQKSVPIPPLINNTPLYITWDMRTGTGDWGYPHSLDLTIYRTQDVIEQIEKLHFHSPNSLESKWAAKKSRIPFGIAHQHASVVNIPANCVQQDCPDNIHSNSHSTHELLTIFLSGHKIDIRPFGHLTPRAPHEPVEFQFIPRARCN